MAAKTKPISARRKLELSQLNPAAVQREVMGEDTGFDDLLGYMYSQVHVRNLENRVTAASITRTIEGASSLGITVNDWDRTLLRSGTLTNHFDVKIDGLWFRLVSVDKSGDELTLTFEDREVAILRTYKKWRIVQRGKMTRAEFVYSLLREVKEYDFQLGKNVMIPELHKVQPIERYSGDLYGTDTILTKSKGIPKTVNKLLPQDAHRHGESNPKTYLTIKGQRATDQQITNANIILKVGEDMGVSRRLKVVAMMTAIQESDMQNLPGGDGDSVGIFQQRPSWGSYSDRNNVETSARLFFTAGQPVEAEFSTSPYWVIAYNIQHPAPQFNSEYARWRTEAERLVNAFGDVTDVPTANSSTSFAPTSDTFYYYRGKIVTKHTGNAKIHKPEDSWDCFQRLGDEVNWRAFFVSGTFYFIDDEDLFRQLPLATVNEFDEGIVSIDGNYDAGKTTSTITLQANVGRWQIPPGSVVVFEQMGPFTGRWLVTDYTRDLIGSSRVAQITLKKPRPQLPEPITNQNDINTAWVPGTATEQTNLPPTQGLETQVLQNKNIRFSNSLETNDVKFGKIDDRVLQAMQWLTMRGYPITITALRSDHSELTTEGRVSAHSQGKAVDIGAIGGVACGDNDTTLRVVQLLAQYQVELGFNQLICPFPLWCINGTIRGGGYDAATLAEHKNHIHLGWN